MQAAEFDFSNDDDGKLIYTVSQISSEIKTILEDSYPAIWVKGEISNFKTYNSGHSYFSLKDEATQIKAVLFAGSAQNLTFIPQDGMNVLLFGRVSSYPARGDYQIIVNHIENEGQGGLAAEFEKLKKKLQAEGLFDLKAKKEIPALVNKIGVITSQDGAALHDILTVLDNLDAQSEVLIYPARVQGKEAETEIAHAIAYLNKQYPDLDVLLIGRGGGSIEDLQAFNTELVARAIFDSKIATISCVGHETDFTIADFVADLRAPTPSAAAEMAVRRKIEMRDDLEALKRSLGVTIEDILEDCTQRLEKFSASRALTKPHLIYEDKIAHIDEMDLRMSALMGKMVEIKTERLKATTHKLDLVSPLNVLHRGFAIVKGESGKIIKSDTEIKTGDLIKIKVDKGQFGARVE
jgi:exodeoxyribonuclease VII large subunit